MPALGTVDEVAARVGELIEDDLDIMLAEACLTEASNKARALGRADWLTASVTPEAVVSVVIAAAARGYQNPGGLDTERADMASLKRAAAFEGLIEFTPGEVVQIQIAAGKMGILSASLSNPDQIKPRSGPWVCLDRGYAPVDWGGNKPFPLGCDGWLG